jgi:large subunit ribosomal protein L31
MQADIHPKYRFVVFRDITNGTEILTKSTIDVSGRDTTTVNGVEYPLVAADITAASHPFYTGQQKIMDTEGRVDAYYRKYGFKNPGQGT